MIHLHVSQLHSYVKDIADFINKIETIPSLQPGGLLVTLNVTSIYTNIPNEKSLCLWISQQTLNHSRDYSDNPLQNETLWKCWALCRTKICIHLLSTISSLAQTHSRQFHDLDTWYWSTQQIYRTPQPGQPHQEILTTTSVNLLDTKVIKDHMDRLVHSTLHQERERHPSVLQTDIQSYTSDHYKLPTKPLKNFVIVDNTEL